MKTLLNRTDNFWSDIEEIQINMNVLISFDHFARYNWVKNGADSGFSIFLNNPLISITQIKFQYLYIKVSFYQLWGPYQ
jgi:hypothetical protein